jgi:hypothetical protein
VIQREQWGIENFCERDIGSVVTRKVAPQRPRSIRQELVRPELDRQIEEVGMRLSNLVGAGCAAEFLSSNNIGALERHQCRREKVHAGELVSSPSPIGTRVKEHRDDDQRSRAHEGDGRAGIGSNSLDNRPGAHVVVVVAHLQAVAVATDLNNRSGVMTAAHGRPP